MIAISGGYAAVQMQSLPSSAEESDSEGDMAVSPLLNENRPVGGEDIPINTHVNGAGYVSNDENIDVKMEPSQCFVYVLTFLSAIGGFLFGYDTGVISGAMILIQDVFNLDTLWKELIVSITIGAAALFAILGGTLNTRLGRKPTILGASLVFTVGAIVLGAANTKEVLLIGRFIVGIGIGLASMTVPMYIAESAPSQMRGRLVTLNNVFITGGQLVASLIDGAFSYDSQDGWRYMLGLAGVPSLIQFVGFLFMPESPRWLVSKGRMEEAGHVLRRMRNRPDVQEELDSISSSCVEDQESLEASGRGSSSVLWQMLMTPHVRRALILGCGLQMIQQISGINTVMYYSATIIQMSGVRDTSTIIWLAAATASVNCLFTFVGLYLVEKIGRRKLTLSSLLGTFAALLVLAVGFQLAANHSPPISMSSAHPNDTNCNGYNWCNDCMVDIDCGYCYLETPSGPNGTCVSAYVNKFHEVQGSDGAMYGPCGENVSDHTHHLWAYDYCPTDYSWMALFGLILYLACFAPGMGPMPWTVNAEIYPLWARSTGISISTATNWIFNLFISMTFLTLTEVLTRYGAFYLYSSFALGGLVFLYFLLPETRGKTLEEVEQLFMRHRDK